MCLTFLLTRRITFSFPPEIKDFLGKQIRKKQKFISCGKIRKGKHFPRELSLADKVSSSSQIQTVTSLYGGITTFGNYRRREKMDDSRWKELTSCKALIPSARLGYPFQGNRKHFGCGNEAATYYYGLVYKLYIITDTQVSRLCFYFTAGEHVQREVHSACVAELWFSLAQSL